jgi:hypothetical protein
MILPLGIHPAGLGQTCFAGKEKEEGAEEDGRGGMDDRCWGGIVKKKYIGLLSAIRIAHTFSCTT